MGRQRSREAPQVLRAMLRSQAGAIDLASIMVGVIVIGVIAGTIAATVFSVIPWSQDAAAKKSLDAVRTAQSVAQVQDARYRNFAGLVDGGRIQKSDTVDTATDEAGSCYVAVSVSQTGKVFWASDSDPVPREVVSTSAPSCVTDIVFAALTGTVSGGEAAIPATLYTISGGGTHTVALDSAGTMWAWGRNNYGQLGDGTIISSSVPVKVVGGMTGKIVSVAAGYEHTVALDSTGTMWAWGANWGGQLGNNTLVDSSVPVEVAGSMTGKIVSIAAGDYHTLAVDSTGAAWSWGYNDYGQVGDGTIISRSVPTAVVGLTGSKIVTVDAGELHTVALDSNGVVWAWGYNELGSIGNGTVTNVSSPTKVTGGMNGKAVTVAAGNFHTLAVDSTGALWVWGYNGFGQVGDGTTADKNLPTEVTVGTTGKVTNVVAGNSHTVVTDGAGVLWAWGGSTAGEGGLGLWNNAVVPTQITGAMTGEIANIAAGYKHTMVLDSAGKLWAFGLNTYGQLGNGTTTSDGSHVAVSNWVQ